MYDFRQALCIFVLLLSLGCDSFEANITRGHKPSIDGFLKNGSGQTLAHKDIPVLISFDDSLPADLVQGCQAAVEQLNLATKIGLVEISSDKNIKQKISLSYGDGQSSEPNHQAHADIEYDGSYITQVSIIFDNKYAFSTSPSKNEFDAQSVCLHEIGHALGLTHSKEIASMMYFGLKNAELRRTPDINDITNLVTIYGQ